MNQVKLQQALQHHRAGRLPEAETLYREVLEVEPHNPDALHLLGLIAHEVNQDDVAEELIRRAMAVAPLVPDFYNSLGQALKSQGKLDEAVDSFMRAVALEPQFADAYLNLGLARREQGELAEAEAALRQAATLRPNFASIQMQLGAVAMAMGNLDRAVEAFTAATQIDPASAESFMRLANALEKQKRLEAAAAAARRAMQLRPNAPETHYNFGTILQHQQRHDEAILAFKAALRLRPDYPDALNNLATSLHAQDRTDEAIAALLTALSLRPQFPQALLNLGAAYQTTRRFDEAADAFTRAIAQKGDFAEAYNNLGLCLLMRQRIGEAIAALGRAIELDPNCAPAYGNLGLALYRQGQHDRAIEAFRKALALRPQMPTAHGNMLLAMNYEPQLDAKTVYDEHVAWAAAHLARIPVDGPAANHDRSPDRRRLRIGYVSADFWRHSVAYFIRPLLEAHDRNAVEVFCYGDVVTPDDVTGQFRSLADQWRDVSAMNHEDLASRVREDRIDILIDLAGHTGKRLPAFARKPAPVQVAYLGYPNTTGMRQIDYRITDAIVDPPGKIDSFYTERLWRLNRCAWCYQPPPDAPDVAPPPVDAAGHITFGSFNTGTKLSPPLLDAWAKLLAQVPDSRLLIKSFWLRDEAAKSMLLERLKRHSIPLDRCDVLGPVEGVAEHLAMYGKVDIALDTHPYNGTATTCEALFMGAAVIALAGDRHASRVSVSLLNAIGLPELVAESWDDYIAKAAGLARDLERLRELRLSLRARMQQSPLMDATGLAREIESAYRQMWRALCAA